MRLGLLSDVHGNLHALRPVLDRLEGEGVDRIVCLGDVVGYGGDPEACVALVRERASVCILGNHDCAAVEPSVRRTFHTAARVAVEAHAGWLDPADLDFLASLPAEERVAAEDGQAVFLRHGMPGELYLFTYLISADQAVAAFGSFRERFAAVGHTHVPALFEEERGARGSARLRRPGPDGRLDADAEWEVTLAPGTRFILNPGSVGQPRDGDPRAACAILDLSAGSLKILRMRYDVPGAQARILSRGLPELLAARLAVGR